MTPVPATSKEALRQIVRDRLAHLNPEQQTADSRRLCQQILALPAWQTARVVFLFSPRPNEPDIAPLFTKALDAGKTLGLPRFIPQTRRYEAARILDPNRDLRPGHFNILEPAPHCPNLPLNRLDLTLVPGVGFTPDGCRLGHGRGYYDRLLATATGLTCGIAFDAQLLESIPTESHDIRLNCILTPTRRFDLESRPVVE
jgi:5-formyltetrahydrofolate cyclo-ligase